MIEICSFDQVMYQPLPNQEVLAYRRMTHPGATKTMMFLHDMTCTSQIFDEIMCDMHQYPEMNLIAVDMRGFGDSSLVTPVKTMKDLVEDLMLFMKAMSMDKVIMVGYSFGCLITMMFSTMYPQMLDRMILMSPMSMRGMPLHYEMTGKDGKTMKKLCMTMDDMMKNACGKMLEAHHKKDFVFWRDFFMNKCWNVGRKIPQDMLDCYIHGTFQQKHMKEMMWMLHNFNMSDEESEVCKGTGEIMKIKTKTLIICGEKDMMVPMKEMKSLCEKLTVVMDKTMVKMMVMTECGHIPFYTEKDKTMKMMRDFML